MAKLYMNMKNLNKVLQLSNVQWRKIAFEKFLNLFVSQTSAAVFEGWILIE
jgi:hypothetical protein